MHYKGKPGLEAALESEKNNRRTYSVAEVADMYGVHVATIYREITAGNLKAMRIGTKKGAVRVPLWAIDEYESASLITGDDLVEVA